MKYGKDSFSKFEGFAIDTLRVILLPKSAQTKKVLDRSALASASLYLKNNLPLECQSFVKGGRRCALLLGTINQ